MLVICEICYNNVVDELSARKGETVCVLCKKEIKEKEREEKKKNRIRVCKVCGLEGKADLFAKGRLTCKKCYAAQYKKERHEHPEKQKKYSGPVTTKQQRYNHKYYLAHKQESLERCRRNRAKKKQCT
ncbi:MAG: hypothetical protein WC178_03455 [Candidatus Paceibacterota bacterium]